MAKTLDEKALADLYKGNSAIALVDCVKGAATFATLDFTDADLIFSIKGSLEINQEDGENKKLESDQGQVLDNETKAGSISFSANYPTAATAAFEYFFKTGKAVSKLKSSVASETFSGKSFFNTPQEKEVSLLLRSQSGKTAIVFARMKLTAKLTFKADGEPLYFAVKGEMLSNLAPGEGDFMKGDVDTVLAV